MGQTKSKTATDIVNEVVPQVLIEHSQNCGASASQKLVIENTGISVFSANKQNLSVNLNCVANLNIDANIVAELSNRIQQAAQSQSVALLNLGTNTQTEVNLKLRNIIAPKITNRMMQEVAAAATQEMLVRNSGISIGGVNSQNGEVVTRAIMTAVAKTGLLAEIENQSSQTAKATASSPLDFLAQIGYMWLIFIVVIIVAIVWLLTSIF